LFAVAGGIILAGLVLWLLPYILEFAVKAFWGTLLLIIGVVAFHFRPQEQALAFWLVALFLAWALFWLLSSINLNGGVKGWLEYLDIKCRSAITAHDIAKKANDLKAHAARIENAKKDRREEMIKCANANLIAALEKKLARFAPSAPVRGEIKRDSTSVFVGDVGVGLVHITGKNQFYMVVDKNYLSGGASTIAAGLSQSLRLKLKASPEIVGSLRKVPVQRA